jgi:PAS domain S-box-containing protein
MRFEKLVRAITHYAVYILDPAGTVTSWNAGAERLKGYAEREIVGENFSRFFTPEEQAAGKPAQVLALAREKGRYEEEGWRVRKDGSRFWALAVLDAIHDADGRLTGFAKITRDMTQRHEAEMALAESERRFRLMLTSIVDYAIFMLTPDGNVASWNPGAERIKGYTSEEIVGRHFSAFYTAEIAPRACRSAPSKRRRATGASKPKGGGCAKTAAGSGRRSSSTRSATNTERSSALPR